jgi:hypothetical protein
MENDQGHLPAYHIQWLDPASLEECDVMSIMNQIRRALAEGVRHIAFAIIGARDNGSCFCGLLVLCDELLRSNGGSIALIEQSDGIADVRKTICESMNIPVFETEQHYLEYLSGHVPAATFV